MYYNPEANKKDAFVQLIVQKLGTCLAIPEEAILYQDELGNDMYFISKGDCAVNIKEWNGKMHIAYNCLVQGQHFGEIALIYKCRRTATIISRNYNTLARLAYSNWREVVNEFPRYLVALKNYIYHYDDMNVKVWIAMINEIEYLKDNLNKEATYDLIYRMKHHLYDKGHMVLKENDMAKSLLFVDHGILEVYTEFEGNEFIIDNLHPGSCINSRAFLMEDTMSVNIRVKETCRIMEMPKEIFQDILKTHDEFGKKVMVIQNKLLMKSNKYPCDYITVTPDILRPRAVSAVDQKAINARRNILKNVVFRRILEIRAIMAKPKLS